MKNPFRRQGPTEDALDKLRAEHEEALHRSDDALVKADRVLADFHEADDLAEGYPRPRVSPAPRARPLPRPR